MRILVFTSLYPNQRAKHCGVFVQEQVRTLAKHHKVTVLAPELASFNELFDPHPAFQMEEEWMVYRPRYLYIPGIWWLFYLLVSFRTSLSLDWKDIAIVHAHVSIPAGFTAALLSWYHRKPFLITEHTGQFAELASSPMRRMIVKWTLMQAKRIIVVSRALQSSIQAEGISGEFRIIPNGVDPEEFFPLDLKPRSLSSPAQILWVGSLHSNTYRNKGVPELLEALAILQNQRSIPVVIHFVGDGDARALCESQAVSLGVADRCYFEGQQNRSEIREWLHRSDALVVASHIESFGVVLIEAMACGKPVVATKCGGPEDIVTPETGVLVESGSAGALAEGIQYLLENYTQYDPQKILSFVESHFYSEKTCMMLVNVYKEMIK